MLSKADLQLILDLLDHASWPEYRGRDYMKVTSVQERLINEIRRPVTPVNHRDTETQREVKDKES